MLKSLILIIGALAYGPATLAASAQELAEMAKSPATQIRSALFDFLEAVSDQGKPSYNLPGQIVGQKYLILAVRNLATATQRLKNTTLSGKDMDSIRTYLKYIKPYLRGGAGTSPAVNEEMGELRAVFGEFEETFDSISQKFGQYVARPQNLPVIPTTYMAAQRLAQWGGQVMSSTQEAALLASRISVAPLAAVGLTIAGDIWAAKMLFSQKDNPMIPIADVLSRTSWAESLQPGAMETFAANRRRLLQEKMAEQGMYLYPSSSDPNSSAR